VECGVWSVWVERVGCGVQGMEREVTAWTVRAAWTVWTVWAAPTVWTVWAVRAVWTAWRE
jgi:hypothetical protein